MLSVSDAYRNAIATSSKTLFKATMTLKDGTVRELTGDDLMQGGLTFVDSVTSVGSFDVGAAVVGKAELSLNNVDGRFNDYDFDRAEVIPFVGALLPDGTVEWLRKGLYRVEQPDTYGSAITLSCWDDMVLLEKPFADVENIDYPASLRTIALAICDECGLSLSTPDFPNRDYVVPAPVASANTSCKDVISWIAQIACCWAKVDTVGRLEFGWYDDAIADVVGEGAGLDEKLRQIAMEHIARTRGETTSASAEVKAWTDALEKRIVFATATSTLTVFTDDVVITGVEVTEEDEEEGDRREGASVLWGAQGYVISVTGNALVPYGKAADAAARIGARLVGLRFRPCSVKMVGSPAHQSGDQTLIIDENSRVYRTYAATVDWRSGGYESVGLDAVSPGRNSSSNFSAVTRAIIANKRAISREATARELAIEELEQQLENASGLYMTEEVQPDLSVIYYMHDKPTLAESTIVWRMTAEALGISTDGGATYPYGLDVSGTAILNRIYAVGINADYINSGAITIKDGEGLTVLSADIDTGTFHLEDRNGTMWDSNSGDFVISSGGETNAYDMFRIPINDHLYWTIEKPDYVTLTTLGDGWLRVGIASGGPGSSINTIVDLTAGEAPFDPTYNTWALLEWRNLTNISAYRTMIKRACSTDVALSRPNPYTCVKGPTSANAAVRFDIGMENNMAPASFEVRISYYSYEQGNPPTFLPDSRSVELTPEGFEVRTKEQLNTFIGSEGLAVYDGWGEGDDHVVLKAGASGTVVGRGDETQITLDNSGILVDSPAGKSFEVSSDVELNSVNEKAFSYRKYADIPAEVLDNLQFAYTPPIEEAFLDKTRTPKFWVQYYPEGFVSPYRPTTFSGDASFSGGTIVIPLSEWEGLPETTEQLSCSVTYYAYSVETSFAVGRGSSAVADSVALGTGVAASEANQAVFGVNNEQAHRALIVGNGDADTLSNALEVEWDGSTTIGGAKSTDPALKFRTSHHNANTQAIIQAHDPGNANGHNLVVRAGGNLVAGGGEYATQRYGLGDITTLENAYIGADGAVYIETNANTIANRRTWTFGAGGALVGAQLVGIDSDATLSARTDVNPLSWRDEDGTYIGQIRASQETDGRIAAALVARTGTGGNIKSNMLRLYVDKAGNCTYYVSSPANFRSAIQLTVRTVEGTVSAYSGYTITIAARKWGQVCHMQVSVKKSSQSPVMTDVTIASGLTAALRPIFPVRDTVLRATGGATQLTVKANGELSMTASESTLANLTQTFTFSYIAASW